MNQCLLFFPLECLFFAILPSGGAEGDFNVFGLLRVYGYSWRESTAGVVSPEFFGGLLKHLFNVDFKTCLLTVSLGTIRETFCCALFYKTQTVCLRRAFPALSKLVLL